MGYLHAGDEVLLRNDATGTPIGNNVLIKKVRVEQVARDYGNNHRHDGILASSGRRKHS